MKIAIDIDGTATAWPKEIATIAKSLFDQGHTVIFLTGCISPNLTTAVQQELARSRASQLETYGIQCGSHYQSIFVCVGKIHQDVAIQKAQYLLKNHVDIFIDDDPDYWREAKKVSPKTLVLGVQK